MNQKPEKTASEGATKKRTKASKKPKPELITGPAESSAVNPGDLINELIMNQLSSDETENSPLQNKSQSKVCLR
jgi:hypothetical protein